MSVRNSVLYSALDKYTQQILLVLTTAVMARLLTPAETGLFLVANSILLLADNLRTFGVGIYIVQAAELKATTLRSAFTVTLLLSLAIMALLVLGAEPMATFYGEPHLADLFRLGALAFLAVPFATPIVALLQRELAFRDLAILNIAVALTNAFVTLGLGMAGFGPASFVWGFVAGSVVLAVLAFATRPMPSTFRPTLAEAGRVLSFGGVSSAITVANMAYELMPRLLLGKLLGADAVGLFARAVTVCQIPDRAITAALTPVVMPVLAHRARSGAGLRESYIGGVAMMSGVQWPALLGLALLADPAVRLLLGAQWTEAAPLVRLVAISMMALAPAFLTFPVLVTAGRIRDALVATLIALPPAVLIVAVAAQGGLTAVAASSLVIAPLQMAVALYFVRRATGIGLRDLGAATAASALVTLASVAGPVALILLSPDGFALGWGETAAAVASGVIGWLAGVWLTDHPLKGEIVAILSLAHRAPRHPAPVPGAE